MTGADIFNIVLQASGAKALNFFRKEKFDQAIKSLKKNNSEIIIGPWFGEVGFEILYWVPFLNFLKLKHDLDPSRFVIISRGNTAHWYSHLGNVRYLDLFSTLSTTEFRDINFNRVKETGRIKQTSLIEPEARILEKLLHKKTTDFKILHPGQMYSFFAPFWQQSISAAQAETFLRFEGIKVPNATLPDPLEPGKFVACKFYFSDAFPREPKNVKAVSDVILKLAQNQKVFLLQTNISVDDHSDAMAEVLTHPNVFAFKDGIPPQENLRIQTEIISQAKAFVGNYGGFSYLAPFLGVPSYSCYSKMTFQPAHNDIMLRALLRLQKNDTTQNGNTEFICMTTEGLAKTLSL